MPGPADNELARALADDDFTRAEALFAAERLPPPVVVWSPDESRLKLRELRFLHGLWLSLRGEAALPVAPDLRPEHLRPALGYIMMLDVVDGGADFRYRLYGSKIAQRAGFDATGKLTSEIGPSSFIATFFLACYRAAMIRRAPLYTEHVPPNQIEVQVWRRLILPMAGADGEVYRFLVGNVPGDWRSRTVID